MNFKVKIQQNRQKSTLKLLVEQQKRKFHVVQLCLQIKNNKPAIPDLLSSYKQDMLNKKPDTIQGFLSPTKLLSGGSRNTKFNSKGNKSPLNTSSYKKQQGSDSKYNSQNQSYLNMSRQIQNPLQQGNETNYSRLTAQNNRFMATQPVGERKYQSERNIPLNRETRTVANHPSRKNNLQIAQQDEFHNQKQRTLEQINNRKWDSQKFRDVDRQSPLYQPKLKNDPTASFKQNFSIPKSSVSEISSLKNGNSQVMAIQCYELIRKLSKIKQNLELQILELQTLLDNTSKYVDNMDDEFQKIKENVLAYTARCLDNAFTEYKQNMVEWQKYEDFERKSLSMLSEMSEYIYNEEQKLSESKKLSYRQITMTAQQLERQIQYYKQFTEEISKIRQQCVGMRPTLSEDRVKEFEKGLAVLCNF